MRVGLREMSVLFDVIGLQHPISGFTSLPRMAGEPVREGFGHPSDH
jgi:hypothetical protein